MPESVTEENSITHFYLIFCLLRSRRWIFFLIATLFFSIFIVTLSYQGVKLFFLHF